MNDTTVSETAMAPADLMLPTDPQIKTGPAIRYSYFKRGKTLATTAFILDDDREGTTRKIQVAFAFCRKGDHFTKKRGREIAEARLLKNPRTMKVAIEKVDEQGKPTFVIEQIKEHIRARLKHTVLKSWTTKP